MPRYLGMDEMETLDLDMFKLVKDLLERKMSLNVSHNDFAHRNVGYNEKEKRLELLDLNDLSSSMATFNLNPSYFAY